ncbi:MAG: ABC transporter ATP-binding protein [Bacteroidia bacterium]
MLSIQDLHLSFADHAGELQPILKGISLEVPKGKTLGIVGESGSGKSVTALTIMQLLAKNASITQGKIEYEGTNLLTLSPENMRKMRGKKIAMIFQEPMTSLNPVFTCGYQVVEALQLHLGMNTKAAKQRTLELFQQVELPDIERIFNAYPHEISGGQKQRVMIAMAISCNPDLLIADEPTTALDVTVQKEVIELLQKLQTQQGMSMIFITHDLGLIAKISEEVVVMYKGEIVEQGKTKAIFENPQHPYTQGLLACRPTMKHRLKILPTVEDFLQKREIDHSVISRADFAARQQTLQQRKVILKVEHLKTYFPIRTGFFRSISAYKKAVDDISFEVYEGETLGLVGESGCGKTTLGRSILRLVEPSSGKVFYYQQEINQLNSSELRKLRKEMQIIFQDPYSSLNPKMKIGEAIVEVMKVHSLHGTDEKRKAKAYEWLAKVGLPKTTEKDYFHHYPHEFSGGQRQRICIARALAVEPKFLICDESVSALDVSVQAQILNLLKQLQAELQLTYIFISHDLSVVKFMSDRVLVMKTGKAIELNDAETLYEQPQQEYTQLLLGAVL